MSFWYEYPMKRRLPSLTALECFEAVMRDGHVTRAAESLNLTQSAVSRQIQKLEHFVRQPLFVRERKRLVPTEAARQFAGALGPLLSELEAQTLRMITWNAFDHVLTLGLLPTFGARWLIPRLSGFTRLHPDIQINIVTGLTPEDFAAAGTDAAIQYGNGDWPGLVTHRLLDETIVAVIAPSIMPPNANPAIEDFDRLQMRTRPTAWAEWFGAEEFGKEGSSEEWSGITETETPQVRAGTRFENFTMMIEAVRAGLGVAVLPEMYIADDLESGRLVAPFGPPVKSRGGYYLAYPQSLMSAEKVTVFKNWLLAEARPDT